MAYRETAVEKWTDSIEALKRLLPDINPENMTLREVLELLKSSEKVPV